MFDTARKPIAPPIRTTAPTAPNIIRWLRAEERVRLVWYRPLVAPESSTPAPTVDPGASGSSPRPTAPAGTDTVSGALVPGTGVSLCPNGLASLPARGRPILYRFEGGGVRPLTSFGRGRHPLPAPLGERQDPCRIQVHHGREKAVRLCCRKSRPAGPNLLVWQGWHDDHRLSPTFAVVDSLKFPNQPRTG